MEKTKIISTYVKTILLSVVLVTGICLFQLSFVLEVASISIKTLFIPLLAAIAIGAFSATVLVYRQLTPEHPLKIYLTYTFLSLCIIETFFTLQVIFVLKDFKPQYAIVPTVLSIVIGLLLSTVILFKQRLQKSHEDIAAAHDEIQSLNKRLETDNLRMSAELEVAQRLQQMLLPSTADLNNNEQLQIASLMQAADEIGGDYYDVIEHNKHTRIVIGDVTGHGLESGVLMLMVQAALRTLVIHDVTNPIQLFKSLNQSIYENVERTQMDKNLTLTMLDYCDGNVTITGQHEEVLIVRKSGEIERIDTLELGFMIGLESDIGHLLASVDVQLYQGDGIVLYTDGLIEAQNAAKETFGVERVCDLLQNCWQQSTAEEVIEFIMNGLHDYTATKELEDDLTLLVCKQIT